MIERCDHFFEQIYEKQFDFIYKIAFASLKDYHYAFDITQDTFRCAYEKIDEIMVHPNPVGWLVKTLSYNLAHEKRNQKIVLELYDSYSESRQQNIKECEGCNVEWLSKWRTVLTDEEIQLLIWFYAYGYTGEEIGRKLGIPAGGCYKRIQRARQKLSKITNKDREVCLF